MGAFLVSIALLSALFLEGSSLMCETCFKINSTSCHGITMYCPSGVTHCLSAVENKTSGGNVVLTSMKSCLDVNKKPTCGKDFFFKNSQFFLRVTRNCCDTDMCNSGDIKVPPIDNTLNGAKCDECFSDETSDDCTPTGEVHCTGNQDTCGSFTGTASGPAGQARKSYSINGCITREACNIGVRSLVGSRAYNYAVKCSLPVKG